MRKIVVAIVLGLVVLLGSAGSVPAGAVHVSEREAAGSRVDLCWNLNGRQPVWYAQRDIIKIHWAVDKPRWVNRPGRFVCHYTNKSKRWHKRWARRNR